MRKTLELKNAILIDGKKVKKLDYDTEEITIDHFTRAEGLKGSSLQKQSGTMMASPVAETDYSMHLYLGFMAIIAVSEQGDNSVDVQDLMRIKGYDLTAIMHIGRNFMLQSAEDTTDDEDNTSTSTQNISEDA